MKGSWSFTSFILCLVPPLCLSMMEADNGGGNVIRDLPCVMRLNQLVCSSAGNSFPKKAIATFIDDNKALLRRMYGELQEPRTVTQTTFTIVRSFGHTSFVAAPLIQGQFASAPKSQQRWQWINMREVCTNSMHADSRERYLKEHLKSSLTILLMMKKKQLTISDQEQMKQFLKKWRDRQKFQNLLHKTAQRLTCASPRWR